MAWIADSMPASVAALLPVLLPLVTAAFVLEALVGFGSTVLVVSIGAQLLPVETLLATYVPVNVVLSLWLVWRAPGAVDRALLVRRILPAMGVGLAAGMAVPASIPRGPLLAVFGALVMALAVAELWAGRIAAVAAPTSTAGGPLHPAVATGVLALGGLIHGLFGSGGPLVVYFAGREGLDKAAFRATLSALWIALNAVLLTGFALRGHLTPQTGLASLALLPALVVGGALGERLHARVDRALFRRLVFGLLFLAGLSLCLRNLL